VEDSFRVPAGEQHRDVRDSGAALPHACTVLAGEGARTDVDLLPDPAAPDRLATLHVTAFGAASPAEIRAHRAVTLRSATVAPAGRPSVPSSAFRALGAAAAAHGAILDDGGLVAVGADQAAVLSLGQALSAVALTAAIERVTMTVAGLLRPDGVGRPRIRVAFGGLAG
jgi:hypothetical protein